LQTETYAMRSVARVARNAVTMVATKSVLTSRKLAAVMLVRFALFNI